MHDQRTETSAPRPRTDEDMPWCVLCGRSPMPVVVEFPDGCCAHLGCADDPVFADLLPTHAETARAAARYGFQTGGVVHRPILRLEGEDR